MERFRFWCVAVSVALGAVISVGIVLIEALGMIRAGINIACGDYVYQAPMLAVMAASNATLATNGLSTLRVGKKSISALVYMGYWAFAAAVTAWANLATCPYIMR